MTRIKFDVEKIASDAYVCGGGKPNCDKKFNPDDPECRECEQEALMALTEKHMEGE